MRTSLGDLWFGQCDCKKARGVALWFLLALFLVLLFFLVGCGGEEPKDIDTKALAEALVTDVPFQDEMSVIDSAVFYELYGLSEKETKDAVLIGSTGATAEEIAVIKGVSQEQMSVIQKAAEQRVEDQKQGFSNYVPEELDKLSQPVIQVAGNCVVLCISNDNEKAKEIIKQYEGL